MKERKEQREQTLRDLGDEVAKMKVKRVHFRHDDKGNEVEVSSEEAGASADEGSGDEELFDSEEEEMKEEEFKEILKKKSAESKAATKVIDTTKQEQTVTEAGLMSYKDELKQAQKFKPAPGVEFTQYDELGLPKNDTEGLRDLIYTGADELDTVVMAAPEVLEKAYAPLTGERFQTDKEVKDMNQDGKCSLTRSNCLTYREGNVRHVRCC